MRTACGATLPKPQGTHQFDALFLCNNQQHAFTCSASNWFSSLLEGVLLAVAAAQHAHRIKKPKGAKKMSFKPIVVTKDILF
jgi:hypothetical protein